MNWFLKRAKEGSTWAGLAAVVFGIGQVAKINEAPAISDGLAAIGQSVAVGVDPITAILGGVAAAAAVILKDKAE